jgi:hypothetical protein
MVVRLRPEEARALGQRITAAFPLDPNGKPVVETVNGVELSPDIWPALREFVPGSPRWLHSADYDESLRAGGREGRRRHRLFLDVEHAVAVLNFPDSTD